VKVDSKLFEFLKVLFGGDVILQSLDLRGGRIESWTKDMLVTHRLMEKLGLMSNLQDWIKSGHQAAAGLLHEKRPVISRERSLPRFETATQVLNALGILNDVNHSDILSAVAEEAANSGDRDRDTLVYRLAMAIYHSKRLSGESALTAVEDPGTLYFSLVRNLRSLEQLGFILEEIQKQAPELRPEFVRVFSCFVVSAYLYERPAKT
jgi:hypothetical protein